MRGRWISICKRPEAGESLGFWGLGGFKMRRAVAADEAGRPLLEVWFSAGQAEEIKRVAGGRQELNQRNKSLGLYFRKQARG